MTEDFGLPVIGFNPTVPQDATDDTVVIGRLSRVEPAAPGEPLPTTTPLATIVNYACHPTTLAWQNTLVSPDYVGAMRDLVEESTGAPVAFFQGPGELAPREQYTGTWRSPTGTAPRWGTQSSRRSPSCRPRHGS